MRNKKYLYIIPIIVFTFIFGVNNVKAENIKHIEYTEPYTGYSFEYDLDIEEYPYYVLGINATYINDVPSFRFEFFYSSSPFYFKYINNKNSSTDNGWLYSVNSSTKYNYVHKLITLSNNKITNTNGTTQQITYIGSYNDISNTINNFYNHSTFSQYNSIYTGGLILVDINHDIYDSSNNLIISKDYINNNSGYSSIPEITVTEFSKNIEEDAFGNNKISSIVYNINFSNFDTSKYKYLYSLDEKENIFSLNPEIITENDFKLLINKNCYIHIKVLDMNDNYITNGTYKIDNIDGFPPTIEKNVNYEVDNITYQNLIKIPISYLYNTDTLDFDNYKLYFLSKSKEDVTSDFYITLLNEKEGKEMPLIVSFQENLQDINKYESSTGSSGQGFSDGGGRHDTCNITPIPYKKTIYNDNTNYYNMLYLTLYGCNYTENLYLEDFSTTYIYIYYNARLYENFESIIEDYERNPDNFEDKNKNFIVYIKNSLNYFLDPISEIFKSLTYFFNGLPTIIRYMIITLFVLGVALIIFKLLL